MGIKGFFKKLFGGEKKYRGEDTFRGECELCFARIDVASGFVCKYCGLWHCTDHRLPEDHQCSGTPINPHLGKLQ